MTEARTRDVSIENSQVLSRQPVRVGCAGWNIPQQAAAHFGSKGSHLERYSQGFTRIVLKCSACFIWKNADRL